MNDRIGILITPLVPLQVYYQLHLADVLWPLAGRDVMMGDNVYTHDEINRVLGADSPAVSYVHIHNNEMKIIWIHIKISFENIV